MDFGLPPLEKWNASYRKLITLFVGVALTGFLIGTVFLEVTTRFTPEGVIEQYKGIPKKELKPTESMQFPKTVKGMLTTTHNHIMGLSSLFLLIGFLYLHGGNRETWRIYVAVEPLISLVVTFGGLWIVRYLWPPFVYLVMLSGAVMIASFVWMSVAVLYHCNKSA